MFTVGWFSLESTFIPEVEQRVQVTVVALFLASLVLRVDLQLQMGVAVSDCSLVVDWLPVEGLYPDEG